MYYGIWQLVKGGEMKEAFLPRIVINLYNRSISVPLARIIEIVTLFDLRCFLLDDITADSMHGKKNTYLDYHIPGKALTLIQLIQ